MSLKLVNEDGTVYENLLSDDALKSVEIISKKKTENRDGREVTVEDAVTSNNLRKFYDQFLKIYDSKADYKAKRIMLLIMKAHTHYSVRRLKYVQFNNFISERIDAVLSSSNENDFNNKLKAFKLNFEVVVGYFKKD
jgi:CRISPR type III-A-associated protein Csm2